MTLGLCEEEGGPGGLYHNSHVSTLFVISIIILLVYVKFFIHGSVLQLLDDRLDATFQKESVLLDFLHAREIADDLKDVLEDFFIFQTDQVEAECGNEACLTGKALDD